ncbi:YdgA family protein [bacterium SCSIO 12696]|nr:YdgA family protein [bacterium SCSIO 12696]
MKKVLTIVVILVVIAVLGGPFFTAKLARQGLEQQVALINEMPGYQAELVNYQKGWFSATTQMHVGIDETALANNPGMEEVGDLGFLMDIDIVHGPLLLRDTTGVGLVAATGTLNEDNTPALTEFRELAGLDTLMTYEQVTNLLGVSSYVVAVPAFDVADDNSEFVFGGFEVAGDYDLKSRMLTGQGALAETRVVSANSTMVFDAMTFDYDLELVNWALQLGEQNMTMPGVRVYPGKDTSSEPIMLLQNLVIVSDADYDSDETVTVKMNVALDKVNAQGMQLEGFNFDFLIERFSVKAIDQFMEMYQNAMASMADPELAQMQMAMGGMALAPEILQQSPVFAIPDLSLKLNGEPLTANARIEVHADGLDMATVTANPQPLLQKLVAGLNLEVSDGLMQQFGAFLGGQQAMMEKTETGYRVQFSMKDGAATLNGQPLPPLF